MKRLGGSISFCRINSNRQTVCNGICGCLCVAYVQMSINVGSSRKIRVSESKLDFLEADTIGQKQASAAVLMVVKADIKHIQFFDDLCVFPGLVLGFQGCAAYD